MVSAYVHRCWLVHHRHGILLLHYPNPAFQWLTDQASGFATILPEAGQWVDIIIKFELGFGIGFEMPLVVFYLVMFGVVPYKKLRASWRAWCTACWCSLQR